LALRSTALEAIIFLAAVVVSVFSTIENGIYVSIGASLVVLLFRIARPGGAFLGRVKVGVESLEDGKAGRTVRDVFLPYGHKSGVHVEPPPEGIVIYRFEESMVFPNA
jgi:sodium-independent sulfate anion transporter 11